MNILLRTDKSGEFIQSEVNKSSFRLFWEMNRSEIMRFTFDGVPFVYVGSCYFACEHNERDDLKTIDHDDGILSPELKKVNFLFTCS